MKAVNSKSKSMEMNGEIRKFRWRIDDFSSIKDSIFSEIFTVDGHKWQVCICPKGDVDRNHLSIYLHVADSATLPSGWSRNAQFGFAVIDQVDQKASITKVLTKEFKLNKSNWGFGSFLALTELHDPKRGYLVTDTCLVEAYVSTNLSKELISHKLMIESILGKQKIKEASCVKAEAVQIKVSPSTQSPSEIVAIKSEEPTKEDMKTFFSSLETEISSSKSNIVYSQDEANEALARLEEALNMTPSNLYYSGKFSPLKQAFKTLANVACSSAILTVEQKSELLVMEEKLKGLADRAAKAMQDKNHFTTKETTKLMVSHNLECSVIRYKEAESELKQVEQKLASLHEQVEEAQNKREIILVEQKEIFRSSKKMKMDLEELGKEWAEDETRAKVAEEEEKTVEAEWGRMKDFISSIKGKI